MFGLIVIWFFQSWYSVTAVEQAFDRHEGDKNDDDNDDIKFDDDNDD